MKTKSSVKLDFHHIPLLAAIVAIGCAFALSAFGGSGNWNVDAAGNWSQAANWNPAVVPGTAAGDVVGLNYNIAAARTITLDTAATVGTLNLGDPIASFFGYTLSGGSTLTFNNNGNGANVVQTIVGGANDTLATPIALGDNLTIYNVNGLTNSGVISGSGYGLTKTGAGTLTLNGASANTYTGPTTVGGGTFLVNFTNATSPASGLINSNSTLYLGGGTLAINQQSATTTSQAFSNTSLETNSTTAIIGNQVSSGALTINLGAITNNHVAAVDFTVPTGGAIETTAGNVNGILGGWATTGNKVSSSSTGDFVATSGGNITTYSSYTTSGTPSGTTLATANYKGTFTTSASATINSFVETGDSTIGSGTTLTIGSGGIILHGGSAWLYAGSATTSFLQSGLSTGELFVHTPYAAATDWRIWDIIEDGSVPTTLVKDGPGYVGLENYNTYSGGTVVNGGTLAVGGGNSDAYGTGITFQGGGTACFRGPLTINPGATVSLTVGDSLGYTSAALSTTPININGGTLDNPGPPSGSTSVNQGYLNTFNLTGGTMSSSGGGSYNFDGASSAINSLASPIVSTISGPIALRNNGLTITTAKGTVPSGIDLNISGVISGGYNLAKAGNGNLTLSGINTYSGGTTVNAGTLNLNNGGSSGCIRGTVTVNSGGILQLSAQDAPGYSGGSVGLTTINLSGGNLNVNTTANETLGSATINLTGGSITGNSGGNIDFFGGGSALNTFASSVTSTISGVPLSPLRQGSTTFTVAAGTTPSGIDLDISSILQTAVSGSPAGSAFIKAGAGYMRLSAANTYTNNTVISAGTLGLGATGYLSNSPNITLNSSGAVFDVSATTFTLRANQTLAGIGSVNGTVNVASGGIITAGTNNADTLTLGGLTFNGTGTLNINPGAAELVVTNANGLNPTGGANSVTINIGTNVIAAGTYTLVSYNGSIQGTGITAFQLGTTPGGLFSYTLVNDTVHSTVDLQVAASVDYWTGAYSSEWSTNILSSPKNWQQSGSPVDFANGTPVIFDDTATGTTTVNLSVANVSPAIVIFNNTNAVYTLQGSAAIAGSTGLTMSGTGTTTIDTTNDFTGAVTINAGTLSVNTITNGGGNCALGAGTNIALGGGTLNYTGGSASSDRSVSVSNPSTVQVASGGATLTLGGAITGAAGLTKTGSGTLVLTNAANSYPSNNINGGTLSVSSTATLGTGGVLVAFGGGTLDFTGSSAISSSRTYTFNAGGGTIQVDNTAGVTLTSPATGTGGLTKTGTGALTLSAVNTYAGGTTVNGGTLNLDDNSGGSGTIGGTLTVNSNATAVAAVDNALGYSGSSWVTNINLNFGTLSTAVSGADNGYGTTINMTGGTLSSSVSGGYFSIGQGSVGWGGVFNINATNVPSVISANLTMRQNLPYAMQFNVARGTATVDLDVSGSVLFSDGDTGGLTKSGPGIMSLDSANTYTGPTIVSNGVLRLSGGGGSSGTLADSAITVLSGAELDCNTTDALGNANSLPLTNSGTISKIDAQSETLFRPIVLNNGTMTSTAYNTTNEAYNLLGGYIDTSAGTTNLITGVGNFGLRTSSCYFTNELDSSLTIACVVQGYFGGTTPLVKTGPGTLTLTAPNIYAGNTLINGGTLALASTGSISNSASISIAAGATFDVSSAGITLAGSSPQQTLASSSTSGTATINAPSKTVILSSNALLLFQAAGGGSTTVARISLSGSSANLALNNNTVTVNVTGSSLAAGTYRLLDCTGTLTGSANPTPTISGIALSSGYSSGVSTTTGAGGHVDLIVYATSAPPSAFKIADAGNGSATVCILTVPP